MRPRCVRGLAFAVALGLLMAAVGLAPGRTDARTLAMDPNLAHDYPTLVIHATDNGLTLPARVPAGRYLVTLQNASAKDLDVLLLRPPAGITLAEVEENLVPDFGPLPAWFYDGILPGGPGSAPAGGQTAAIVDLSVGPYVVVPITAPDLAAPLEVVPAAGASPAPSPPPAATATITLSEMAFGGLPPHLAAARGLWKITNTGQQPHQLTLIKAPAGTTPAQVRTLLTLPSNGTPPPGIDLAAFAPVGGLGVLSPGQTAWAVVDLAPGTYVALCHVPDRATGTPDALLGMLAVFTVDGAGTSTPAPSATRRGARELGERTRAIVTRASGGRARPDGRHVRSCREGRAREGRAPSPTRTAQPR